MATQPTPGKPAARKAAAPRARRKAVAPAPHAAAPAATAFDEATAADAIARLRTQLAETIRSAQEAAEAAARDLPARLAEQVKAAEAASDRVLAQVAAAEAAVDEAIARLDAGLADSLGGARAAAEEAGRRVNAQLSEQIAAAEAAVAALRGRSETPLRGTEGASRQAATVGRTALAGAEATGAMVLEGLARAQKEVADFVGARIRHDVEAQGELLGCRNLEDLRDVQARYVRSAIAQYSEEAARLVKLGTDLARRAIDRSRG